ncbi:MAG: hypothetical protein A2X22_09435 [Bacteroidetes bacterium GWF2_49_14]|nr:MAG: hypothetical protein A2X22_09435 [Bacteroidetes bacterium GWF2_49_14]
MEDKLVTMCKLAKYYLFVLILGFMAVHHPRGFAQTPGSAGIHPDSLFHIQVSASRQLIDAKNLDLDPETSGLINVMLVEGWYKYSLGNFPTHESAQNYLSKMKKPGFIARYKNGRLIRSGADRFPNTVAGAAKASVPMTRIRSMERITPMPAPFYSDIPEKKARPSCSGRASGTHGGIITDSRDGETYRWVRIGSQEWLAENLRYSALNKPKTTQPNPIILKYGRLYNFKTAEKACPEGWHLPSDAEWLQLEEEIGLDPQQLLSLGYRESNDAGRLLKSTDHWKSGGNGYDLLGFGAVPAGMAKEDGSRKKATERASFWSNSKSGMAVWIRQLRYNSNGIVRGMAGPDQSMSVRCVK